MSALLKHVDFSKPSLYYSLASITFNPTAWNIVARNGKSFFFGERRGGVSDLFESIPDADDHVPMGFAGALGLSVQSIGTRQSRRFLEETRSMGAISLPRPSSLPECFAIACAFSPPSCCRPIHFTNTLATRFHNAIADQPHVQLLPESLSVIVPAVLVGLGQLFVVTSTWQLGITGTFLGDYFGILMDHRVEGFPFNVLRDPMYVGSTMTFIGTSLWYESPLGLLISLYVYIAYIIALRFEGCVSLFIDVVSWV